MAYSKRSVVTVLSVLFLVALTVVACYAHYNKQRLSVPIPSILSGLAIVLPAIHGICLERLTRRPRSGLPLTLASHAEHRSSSSSISYSPTRGPPNKRHDSNNRTTFTVLALTIFTTVLATVAGTHLAPAGTLKCALAEKWLQLFRNNQGAEIRRIQDTFDCCGLSSVYDMAWPFAKHEGGKTMRSTCVRTYGRDQACFGAWRGQEQIVAGLIIVVCGGVWLLDMFILYTPGRRPSWMSRARRGAKANGHGADSNGHARPAIEYHDTENGNGDYHGTPAARVVDADPEDASERSIRSNTGSVQRAIEARLGIDGEHDEHHTLVPSSQTNLAENEWARS